MECKKCYIMNSMFQDNISFNQPIDTSGWQWNVSTVTNMASMFQMASKFNQSIEKCNTQLTDLSNMFQNATSFNQPIDSSGNWWNIQIN